MEYGSLDMSKKPIPAIKSWDWFSYYDFEPAIFSGG